MNLLDYIKGNRKGENAHRVERESMRDPFMYEAIEGFESIEDDHLASIEAIQKRIKGKSQKQTSYKLFRQFAAACIVGVLMIGGFFLIDGNRNDMYAQERDHLGIIDIYVPEQFYSDNIAIIAQNNTEQVKAHKPNVKKFTLEDMNIPIPSGESPELLADNRVKDLPIDIYMPSDSEKNIEKKRDTSPMIAQTKAVRITQPKHQGEQAMMASSSTSRSLAGDSDAFSSKMLSDNIVEESMDTQADESLSEIIITTGYATRAKKSIPSAADALILESIPVTGMDQYNIYLQREIKHPTDSTCAGAKGEVILEFKVKWDGTPDEIKVIKSLCLSCDKEAIRLLKEGSKWNAYRQPARLTINF